MSSHHPSSELLKSFADARLDACVASVVSAHIEHCSICQKFVRSEEKDLSSRAFSAKTQVPATETSEAWKKVSSRMGGLRPIGVKPEPQCEIAIDEMKFILPRALHKFAANPLRWVPFGRGGKISKLGRESGKDLFLIYLASSEEVPLHSHNGTEHSYVIAGSYLADGLKFETGDFSVSTESVTHAPRAGSKDGCLLLSSIESRLNFFQGWLKPFNALLWWALNLKLRVVK